MNRLWGGVGWGEKELGARFFFCLFVFVFLSFVFLGPHPRQMKVPRLGV